MSRKKGIIENPDWEEEVNDTFANQDDEIQKKIEEMYKSLHSKNKKDGAERKEETSNDSNESSPTPPKTLWEIAMEGAEEESEYEDDGSGIKQILEKILCVIKKISKSTLIFLKKCSKKAIELIKIIIKRLKNNGKPNNKIKTTKVNADTQGKEKVLIKSDEYEDDEEYIVRKRGTATSELAFISTNKGAGTTYTAFICASALSKRYKVCVLELNGSNHFSTIFEYLNGEIPYKRKMFKYKNIDYYFNLSYDQFVTEFRPKYDFVIIDYSHIENINDFVQIARSDKVFAIIDGTYWRINELEKNVSKLKEKDRAKSIIYLNPIREPIAEIKKMCFPNKVVKVPFVINPFKPDKLTVKLFYKLLKIKY